MRRGGILVCSFDVNKLKAIVFAMVEINKFICHPLTQTFVQNKSSIYRKAYLPVHRSATMELIKTDRNSTLIINTLIVLHPGEKV